MTVQVNVQEVVAKSIAEIIGTSNTSQITPEKLLAQDLGLDSLDKVELSMAIEDYLNIEVQFDHESAELDTCNTVQDVIDLAIRKMEAKVSS